MSENLLKKADLVVENENVVVDSVLMHKATPEYLQELLKDKRQLQNFPNIFLHLEFILEKEISRVRQKLFYLNESVKKNENELPVPSGKIVSLQEKVFVPVKENPNYNFVGRLLGPRGLTAKQLEQDLECKIMVRGKGSLRDKRKEDLNKGKPNWEHLDEELHVLVSVEDFENRAVIKLRRASETIRAFLEQGVRTPENEDRLKQLQLMELAVLNDKDRQQAHIQQVQQHQQLILQHQSLTVLNHQAAAAAAAAAAQILPSNKYTSSNILPQIHSQVLPASLTTNCLLPGAINSALPHATSVHSISNSQLSHSVPSLSSANLSTYLPNTNLSGLLYPLTANATLSAAVSTGPPTNNGQLNLSLPLSQIAGGITGSGLSGLPLSIGSTLHAASHDQLAAVAAALLGGSGTGGIGSSSTNLHLCNGNMNNTVPNINSGPHSYPITPHTSLADAVNILEYNSTSNAQDCGSGPLKLRSVQASSSSVARMHPYLRQ
ncbi:Protein held out wings isoform 2 [Schistosoma japonicum]|uniref:Protein held out wings isoform 2 n=1 Tax=Schistosoma japonicum TaxID=6182 RepID=A0A4Z2CSY2_SCHJA|nr:Protein held out wings isoform 2 [Schistosoma japonicum]TNN07379.1 Protein held out wings isoform 2 [Schistosoma japonicum]TNN07380.1 Protein held out wings isoform 2 [Schistosoma japonicum]